MHLISFEVGHSPRDIIAYLPEDRGCFAWDILFKDSHSWLCSEEPELLFAILRKLAGWDIERFVPGHGGISSRDDVLLQADYIDELLRLVRDKVGRGDIAFSLDELSPVFREWRSSILNGILSS